MSEDTLYQIAVSPIRLNTKPEKGDRIWEELTTSHVSGLLTPIEIANVIYLGQQTTNWHAPLGQTNRRCADNWLSSQVIYVDFDAGTPKTTLQYVCALPFVKRYAMLAHTTMSHTADAPRCRVLFGLSAPVTDKNEWKKLAVALVSCFEDVDLSCTAISRPFLGSPGCDVQLLMKQMSVPYLRYVAAEIQAKKAAASAPTNGSVGHRQPQYANSGTISDEGAERNLASLVQEVAGAKQGNRNEMLNWAAHKAAQDLISKGLVNVQTAHQRLMSAAESCGLDRREAAMTIHSAFKGGGVVGVARQPAH